MTEEQREARAFELGDKPGKLTDNELLEFKELCLGENILLSD